MIQTRRTPSCIPAPRLAGLLLATSLTLCPLSIAAPDAAPPPPPAQGEAARLFTVPDLDGQAVDVASITRGKVSLIAMWASWCEPCISEIPRLRDLARAYRERGLVVVGIGLAQGDETPAKQRHAAARHLVNYQLLFDARKEFQKAYGLRSLPFTLLLGPDGGIRWQGPAIPGDIETRIQSLLREAAEGGGHGG
jgi:peroxiredoxin